MLTGILIFVIVGLLAVLTHRRTRLEEKIIRDVALTEWLLIILVPITFYLSWFFVVKNILERPLVNIISLTDFDILVLTILFMAYGSVGNGLHFASKVIWKNLKGYEDTHVYKVNEMFHNKLSHYLVYLNSLFIFFLLVILEVNHPLQYPVMDLYLYEIGFSGFLFGLFCVKSFFYTNEWFGGYNKPLFFIVSSLTGVLLVMSKLFGLKISSHPAYFFVLSLFSTIALSFIVRQIFIFANLDEKKRLNFLNKFFSLD